VSANAQDVTVGIRVAGVSDPFGSVVGLTENPNFKPAEQLQPRISR